MKKKTFDFMFHYFNQSHILEDRKAHTKYKIQYMNRRMYTA